MRTHYFRKLSSFVFLACFGFSFFLAPVEARPQQLWGEVNYPSPEALRCLSRSILLERVRSTPSLLDRQYLLKCFSQKDFRPRFEPQEIGGGLFQRLLSSVQLGIPLFLQDSGVPFRSGRFEGRVLLAKLLEPNRDELQIVGKLEPEFFLRGCPSGFAQSKLSIPFSGLDQSGKLVRKGEGFLIPETWTASFSDFKIDLVPPVFPNPKNDQACVYITIRGISKENIQEKITRAVAELGKIGIPISFASHVCRDLFMREKGFPQKYLDEIYTIEAPWPSILYPCTFIMPGKTGFGNDLQKHQDLLMRIFQQGFLSSARERLNSFSGAPVREFDLHMGNESPLYLSYGSGITYAAPESYCLIVSPRVAFLEGARVLDRASLFFRARLFHRDPLSEAWFSSYEAAPPELFAAIRRKIDRFFDETEQNTLDGRRRLFRRLDDFYSKQGLMDTSGLSCALYEEANNAIRIPDALFIEDFGECLILPSEEERQTFLAAMKKSFVSSKVCGLPLEDFLISAPQVDTFRPDGTRTGVKFKIAYVEYLFREARRPEYLAMMAARQKGDSETLIRIAESLGSILKEILGSKELEESRKLRDLLRSTPSKEIAEYSRILERYRWWKSPTAQLEAQARAIGPMDRAFLQGILDEVREAVKRTIGRSSPVMRIDFSTPGTPEETRYIGRSGGNLSVNFKFLSGVRMATGLDGIYHIIVQESLIDLVPDEILYGEVINVMNSLGHAPCFEALAEFMELSIPRKNVIMERVKMK